MAVGHRRKTSKFATQRGAHPEVEERQSGLQRGEQTDQPIRFDAEQPYVNWDEREIQERCPAGAYQVRNRVSPQTTQRPALIGHAKPRPATRRTEPLEANCAFF